MIKRIIFLNAFLFILSSCVSTLSSSFTKPNYVDRNYQRIAVIGISDNLTSRLAFEKEAVTLLKEKGVNAVGSTNIFPQNMSKEEQAPKNLIKIIKTNNLDGIITMSLVDVEDSHRYKQGKSYSIPSGYYRVGKHIYRRYVTINEPGYYVPTRSYVIEAVLYNLKGELKENQDTWVWTGESSLINPSSLQSSAEIFSKRMVNQIIKDNIILIE